jgi:hypothetical protein
MRLRLFILTFAFSGFAIAASAQTIADVARAERERRKVVRSGKISITSTETTASSVGTPAPQTATTPSGTPAPATPGEFKDNKGRDEKSWRAIFQQARADAKRAEDRVAIVDLKIKQLNTDMLQYSSFYNRENRLGPELTAAQKELEEARAAAELAKKKISDLEEELRRSGGPAGWAR